jgi:hypothetical protein
MYRHIVQALKKEAEALRGSWGEPVKSPATAEDGGEPCANAKGYLVRRFFLAEFRRALSYFFMAFRCFFDILFSTFCCCLASFRDRRIFSAVVVCWACAGIDAATPKAASSRMKVAIRFIMAPNGILQRSYTENGPRRAHKVLLL